MCNAFIPLELFSLKIFPSKFPNNGTPFAFNLLFLENFLCAVLCHLIARVTSTQGISTLTYVHNKIRCLPYSNRYA